MAKRNGGIIGPANTPTSSVAAGVWRLRDAFNSIKNGTWPLTRSVATNSLRFNSASSDYLNRTPASAGNRQKFTISLWTKRSAISGSNSYRLFSAGSDGTECYFGNDSLAWYYYSGAYVGQYKYQNTALFRDASAWYHIVIAVDTTQATASNRVKIYVNGVEGAYAQTTITQNSSTDWNNNVAHYIGRYSASSSYFYDGYISEFHNIDGQQLDATSFGASNSSGVWYPIAYQGTYGTNGFYLKFANSASLGTDSSGNGNNWTVNNLTSVDQSTDTELNNFCTLSSVDINTGGTAGTLTEGNLKLAHLSGASGSHTIRRGTIAVNKGKWYSEYKLDDIGSGTDRIGIINIEQSNYVTNTNPYLGFFSAGYAYLTNGNKENNNSQSAYGATYTTGDIIGVALDCDNGTLIFYKNGVSQGTAFTGLDTSLYYTFSSSPYNNQTGSHNFGNPPYSANGYTDAAGYGNFSYAVPSGYYALCTKNLNTYG